MVASRILLWSTDYHGELYTTITKTKYAMELTFQKCDHDFSQNILTRTFNVFECRGKWEFDKMSKFLVRLIGPH